MSNPIDAYAFLVGVRINKAKQMLPNMWIRVLKRDGVEQPVDSSAKSNRINVETERWVITKIIDIG